MKIGKMILKGLMILILIIAIILTITGIYNQIMIHQESSLLNKPLGQMVEVDGHRMCIYTKGKGKKTLVFLSGSATASPILDFKGLYSRFNDDYRIVVIEKFGYGFSDIVDTERSFDTILRQDREALRKVGINGPLVLCPHSMSGLEAILWAQKYPQEVKAIVGLDMCLPDSYDHFDFNQTERMMRLGKLGRQLGLVRLFYQDSTLPSSLTKKEKAIYRAIASKNAVNTCIINEVHAIRSVIKEIKQSPKIDIPMLLCVSNGKEIAVKNWIQLQEDYASHLSHAKLIKLDCGHYVHNHKTNVISKEMKLFINKL